MNKVVDEIREINGKQAKYIEYDKVFSKDIYKENGELRIAKGTPYSETRYLPTQSELDNERKAELVVEMERANALRDDVAWQAAKDEYDAL